ncbi:serine/threonine-protein kinase [Nonomuraea sp. NPDC050663]|uniref:serine/threonine-protein kinase n=1 Tax=Nonomuraea sp. NPDC050663 TaxID=3364370 RepID=UPI0037AF6C44
MSQMLAGRYRLMSELGRGGMGTVWHAHDELLDREVAIKEVAGSPVRLRRTEREARLAARLDHPNIAAVYDMVREAERLWIVMRLIHARTLGRVIAEDGPLPPSRVAAVGLDVLAALQAAHEAGIVHRDVKPDNILLPEGGGAVLTDFGIAASMGGDGELTQTDVVLGTPAFIAPERATGAPSGPAGDLWSLGATLYTAVEGRQPFARANGMATLVAVVHDPPLPCERAGELEEAITALLRKEPAARPGLAETRDLLLRARIRWDEPATTESGPAVTGPAAAGLIETGMIDTGLTGPGSSDLGEPAAGTTGPGLTPAGVAHSGITSPDVTGPGVTPPGVTGSDVDGPGVTGSGVDGPGATGPAPAPVPARAVRSRGRALHVAATILILAAAFAAAAVMSDDRAAHGPLAVRPVDPPPAAVAEVDPGVRGLDSVRRSETAPDKTVRSTGGTTAVEHPGAKTPKVKTPKVKTPKVKTPGGKARGHSQGQGNGHGKGKGHKR